MVSATLDRNSGKSIATAPLSRSLRTGIKKMRTSVSDKMDSVLSVLADLFQAKGNMGDKKGFHVGRRLVRKVALACVLAVVCLNIYLACTLIGDSSDPTEFSLENFAMPDMLDIGHTVPNYKVSVVIMNHLRPQVIKYSSLVRTLISHPNIDEILLLHSNPDTAFQFVHPKIINYDASKENEAMGLALRFHFAQFASNPTILFVDDDMEFNSTTLDGLFTEFYKNTKRIVGIYGRDWSPEHPETKGYSCENIKEDTEVVLTKLMLTERDVCQEFFRYEYVVQDIVDNAPGPKWNGEDIFMSLVATHAYGKDGTKNNYAMPWLPIWEASNEIKGYSDGRHDISGVGVRGNRTWDPKWVANKKKVQAHRSFRGEFMHVAAKRLAALGNSSTASSNLES